MPRECRTPGTRTPGTPGTGSLLAHLAGRTPEPGTGAPHTPGPGTQRGTRRRAWVGAARRARRARGAVRDVHCIAAHDPGLAGRCRATRTAPEHARGVCGSFVCCGQGARDATMPSGRSRPAAEGHASSLWCAARPHRACSARHCHRYPATVSVFTQARPRKAIWVLRGSEDGTKSWLRRCRAHSAKCLCLHRAHSAKCLCVCRAHSAKCLCVCRAHSAKCV